MIKDPVIAVALSGGVDSLVTGYMLKQKYKNVFGIHFITGYEKKKLDLSLLENQLGFKVHLIDLSKSFEQKVIQYFVQTYLDGKTPNPCMICNKEIKFGELFHHAKRLGADYLSTGHYARVVNPISFPDKAIDHCYLEKGLDPKKDQSYFLSLLSQAQLEKIIFPLAGMIKEDVKKFAQSKGIAPLHPSESQDICFIHDNNFANFIIEKEKTTPEHGNIVNGEGKIVGRHQGLHKYTIGQRRGLNCPASEPYYVKKINMNDNILEVCFKKDLSQDKLSVEKGNWNFTDLDNLSNIMTKIRYSHKGAESSLKINKTFGDVVFKEPQNAITPGQGAVFYNDNRVIGAGIIL